MMNLYKETGSYIHLENPIIIGYLSIILNIINIILIITSIITTEAQINQRLIMFVSIMLVFAYMTISLIYGSNKLGVKNINVYTRGTGILYIILLLINIVLINDDKNKDLEVHITIITIISLIVYLYLNTTSEYIMSWNLSTQTIHIKNTHNNINPFVNIHFKFNENKLEISGELTILDKIFAGIDNISENDMSKLKDDIKKATSKGIKGIMQLDNTNVEQLDNTNVELPNVQKHLDELAEIIEEIDKFYNRKNYHDLLNNNYTTNPVSTIMSPEEYAYFVSNILYKFENREPVSPFKFDRLPVDYLLVIQENKVKNKKIFPWILEKDSISEYIKMLQEQSNIRRFDLYMLLKYLNCAIIDSNAYKETLAIDTISKINAVLEKLMLITFTVDSSPMKVIRVD